MDELRLPDNEKPVVRSQSGLKLWSHAVAEIEHNKSTIEQNAARIENPKIRQLYRLRALYNIKDPGGRFLTIEELAYLDKYVRGEDLTDEELRHLDELLPEN